MNECKICDNPAHKHFDVCLEHILELAELENQLEESED